MSRSRHKNVVSLSHVKPPQAPLVGSTSLLVVAVMMALFVSGGCYLYTVNQNAVQGYHMRTLEREIATLSQKNAELKIVEADLRSLHRIEEVSIDRLEMQKFENVKYLEEPALLSARTIPVEAVGPMALR